MLRSWVAAFLLLLWGGFGPMPATHGLAGSLALGAQLVGEAVPMQNVDGTTVSVGSVRGPRGTRVVFTSNHCPWSKSGEGRIVDLGNRYATRGAGVIAVNPNDPEAHEEDSLREMQERARAAGLAFPDVVDATGDVARAFGATKTPEGLLFDGAGRLGRLVCRGVVDDNANDPRAVRHPHLQDALEAVLAGAAVPRPETQALEWAIKARAGRT